MNDALSRLVDRVDADIHNSALYKSLHAGVPITVPWNELPSSSKIYSDMLARKNAAEASSNPISEPGQSMPKKVRPLVETQAVSLSKRFVGGTETEQVLFPNVKVDKSIDKPEWHVFTGKGEEMLCAFTDGSLGLVFFSYYKVPGVVAILEFPVGVESYFGTVETEHEWVESFGFCCNMRDLVYIPPIPEGVKYLNFSFQNCPKLNCPIFLPSTVISCRGMLEGCTSFSSPIYVHKIPDNGFELGEYAKFLVEY